MPCEVKIENVHTLNMTDLFTDSFEPSFFLQFNFFRHFHPSKMKIIDDLLSSIPAFPKNEHGRWIEIRCCCSVGFRKKILKWKLLVFNNIDLSECKHTWKQFSIWIDVASLDLDLYLQIHIEWQNNTKCSSKK